MDIAATILAAPVWLPALAIAAAWAKLQHAAPVFVASERIGYGGRAFRCYSLCVAPQKAVVTPLHREPAAESKKPAVELVSVANQAENTSAKWRRAIERLPQVLNVLRGDMSLVGPRPLTREELDPLKTAKRYYLSARPGVIGISPVADAGEEEASQYKLYALSWSLTTDALIAWESLVTLKDRGELWRPGMLRVKRDPQATPVVVRRRTDAA